MAAVLVLLLAMPDRVQVGIRLCNEWNDTGHFQLMDRGIASVLTPRVRRSARRVCKQVDAIVSIKLQAVLPVLVMDCNFATVRGWMPHSNAMVCIDIQEARDRIDELQLLPYVAMGFWSNWSALSPCSVSCGMGFQYQTRQCLGAGFGCVGEAINTTICNASLPCPSMSMRNVTVRSTHATPFSRWQLD